jgi:hypothetical protein
MVDFEKLTAEFRAQTGDIRLKDATIVWNIGKKGWNSDGQHGDGRVAVIPYPDSHDWRTYLGINMTNGAGWRGWQEMSKAKRLLELMRIAWQLVCMYGVEPAAIHRAFQVIPEYRNCVSIGFNIMGDE